MNCRHYIRTLQLEVHVIEKLFGQKTTLFLPEFGPMVVTVSNKTALINNKRCDCPVVTAKRSSKVFFRRKYFRNY